MKKVVESGMLGSLVEFESHIDKFRNYSKNNWREEDAPGSGLLYDEYAIKSNEMKRTLDLNRLYDMRS